MKVSDYAGNAVATLFSLLPILAVDILRLAAAAVVIAGFAPKEILLGLAGSRLTVLSPF